jgi:hypothetical protein
MLDVILNVKTNSCSRSNTLDQLILFDFRCCGLDKCPVRAFTWREGGLERFIQSGTSFFGVVLNHREEASIEITIEGYMIRCAIRQIHDKAPDFGLVDIIIAVCGTVRFTVIDRQPRTTICPFLYMPSYGQGTVSDVDLGRLISDSCV